MMQRYAKARLSSRALHAARMMWACALSAAHDVLVGRSLAQEAALQHPVDLLLELGGLVVLHAGQLRQQAILAQLRLEIAQELGARATLVLRKPFDGAVER